MICNLSRGCSRFFSRRTEGAGDEDHNRLRAVRPGPAQGQPQEARARRHALRRARVGDVRIRQLCRVRAVHGAEPRMAEGAWVRVPERRPEPRRVPIRVLRRRPRTVLGLPAQRLVRRVGQGEARERVHRREGAEALQEARRKDSVRRERLGGRGRDRARGGEGGREVERDRRDPGAAEAVRYPRSWGFWTSRAAS